MSKIQIDEWKINKFLRIIYSIDSPIYAADNVANTSACTELANIPNTITGRGISRGTSKHRTETTISSAKMFPNKRKLKERGFVKSSNMLIGKKIGVGEIYLAKNQVLFL
jgi:hypothetical protein